MRAALLLLPLLTGCGARIHAHVETEASSECGREPGYDYCVTKVPPLGGKPSRTVLYFMHGGGDGAETWGRWPVAKEFYRSYRERGESAPAVVSISFGKLWLLTEKSGVPGSGFLEKFLNEAMPLAERKTGAPERRLLWGMSMGSFNALELVLKRPELWKAAVLSCPGVVPFSPQASPQEVQEYVARTGADKSNVEMTVGLLKQYFPNGEVWDRHDPFQLIAAAGPLPPILIECGDKDEFGFWESSRKLAESLSAAGDSVELHRVRDGKHCSVTPETALKFLYRTDRE